MNKSFKIALYFLITFEYRLEYLQNELYKEKGTNNLLIKKLSKEKVILMQDRGM